MPPKKKGRTESEDEKLTKKSSSASSAVTEESVLAGTVPFVRLTKDSQFDPKKMLKIMSWNVAGLRSLVSKDGGKVLTRLCETHKPDILCLQETKLQKPDPTIGVVPGYTFVDSVCSLEDKKGYSGTRTYVKKEITDAAHVFGFGSQSKNAEDPEGRVITTVISKAPYKICLLNSYVPNAGQDLGRLEERIKVHDPVYRKYLQEIHSLKQGTVIWTGDLNVAERDYDRFFSGTWKQMQKVAGFTPEERESFRKTLSDAGLVDAFREKYPNAHKVYTFHSFRFNCREKGNGYRLDYFCVSKEDSKRIVDCFHRPEYAYSDHYPLELWLSKA